MSRYKHGHTVVMRIAILAALALFVLPGCSEDEVAIGSVDSGAVDTSVPDTAQPDTAQDTLIVETSTDTGPDVVDAPADTYDVCADIAMQCGPSQPCPASLRCYGEGDTSFCAAPMPECGGILVKICAGGRTCLRPGGSTAGYCATEEEKPCICSRPDAGKVDGC